MEPLGYRSVFKKCFLPFLFILQFSAVLQSEEHIPADSRNPLKQSPEVTYSSFTSVQENCLHTKKTHLVLPIPFTACPEFESDLGKPGLNLCLMVS